MPRPRKSSTASWPTGLYRRRRGAKVYYFFRQGGKEVQLGPDLTAAVAAVRLFDRRTAKDPVEALVQRLNTPKATLHQILDLWLGWWREDEKPKKGTFDNQRWRVGKIKRLMPDRDIAVIDRFELARLLDGEIVEGEYGRYRDLLIQAFAWARSKGYRDDNPAEHLLEKAAKGRKRGRLTEAQYEAIYAIAPRHLQLAMELIRHSFQRPGDLCQLKLSAWDGAVLKLTQEKTGTQLEIVAHAALRKALGDAAAYRIADCDALLVYMPDPRARNEGRVGSLREHWAQCTDQMLSRHFTDLMREKYPDLDKPPTLYECKSLGMSAYRNAGWPRELTQRLAAHKRPETSEGYEKGHSVVESVNLAAL